MITSTRPTLYSETILRSAIERFTATYSLYGRLDCDSSDEEELLDALGRVSVYDLDDPDSLARSYADDVGMDVSAAHFEVADELVQHARDALREKVAEWVASGGATRTVSDTARVRIASGGDVLWGCAFVDPTYDKYGEFAFVPDEKLEEWKHPDGGVTSYRIVQWEAVGMTSPPLERDMELVAGQRRRREQEATASAEYRLRGDAARSFGELRNRHKVDLAQAQALWDELLLGDDIERALRIHNAIAAKLTALEIERLRAA